MKNLQPFAKTVVIGIGNSILSDDAVGIKAVQAIQASYYANEIKKMRGEDLIKFIEVSTGGINLMEHMEGFQTAVLIDAIVTGRHKAGTIFKFIYPDIPYTRNTVSTHDMDLPMALEMGKHLGISLPSEIIIFAVEAKDTVNFGENLTEEVEIAMGSVVHDIKLMLDFN
jgi:hydrogenase maturation protease